MKKIITAIFALALSFEAFAQQNDTMFIHRGQTIYEFSTNNVDSIIFYRTGASIAPGIDTVFVYVHDTIIIGGGEETPLGEISFRTTQEWTLEEQTWSDVVMASGCKKDDYNGGSTEGYLADCRQNPGHGDMFSWTAVNEYKDALCPDGWRVPTRQDFVELDSALGGTGEDRYVDDADVDELINNTYLSATKWGGEVGGCAEYWGDLGCSAYAYYWSLTEEAGTTTGNAHCLGVSPQWGAIFPRTVAFKATGIPVRCVKNSEK